MHLELFFRPKRHNASPMVRLSSSTGNLLNGLWRHRDLRVKFAMPKGAGLRLTKTMGQAKGFGHIFIKKALPVLTILHGLDMLEQYSQSEDDVNKLKRMEARMYERLQIAYETLEVARQSPLLANSRSTQQLECAMRESRKYLETITSLGPLFRGASKTKIVGKLERYSLWLTDALVAVQVDTVLAATRGLSAGGMPQMLMPSQGYYYPVGGGGIAPVQMIGPMDQAENALTGQQPQPLLMPSSMPPQQQVPVDNQQGVNPILTGPGVWEETSQEGEAEAGPAGAAIGVNNSGTVSPMIHPSSMAPADAMKEVDGTGWPNSAFPAMAMHQAPPTPGQSKGIHETGCPGNPETMENSLMTGYTPSSPWGVSAAYDGAGWFPNFLPPTGMTQSPTLTMTPTAFPGVGGWWPNSSARISPMMMHQTPFRTMGTPPMSFDGVTWYRNIDPTSSVMGHTPVIIGHPPVSPDDKPVVDPVSRTPPLHEPISTRERSEYSHGDPLGDTSSCQTMPQSAPGDSVSAPSSVPHHDAPEKEKQSLEATAGGKSDEDRSSDSIHGATKQLRKALGLRNTASRDHSDPASQSQRGANGALQPKMIVYDSTGTPYNFDADTGQCYPYYPAGWSHDSSGLLRGGQPYQCPREDRSYG